jgi:hypothetical protein
MATYPIQPRHWTRKECEHLVELGVRVLEVYREPVIAPAARFDWKYDRARILKPEATVSPLALPDATIAVADLLP